MNYPDKCSQVNDTSRLSSRMAKTIFDHLQSCVKCDPVQILEGWKGREIRLKNDVNGVSTTIVRMVERMTKKYPHNSKIDELFVWFIQHARSWNLKVYYSKKLTKIQTVESILNQAVCLLNCFPRNSKAIAKMYWPCTTYYAKHYERKTGPKRIVTAAEDENDRLFGASTKIDKNILIEYVGRPEELLLYLEAVDVLSS